ncbi:MAG: hypothetical protein GWN58_27615 [Anaerolineae bacterium]|nr:hypothetical protein [Anaerolineae bacterium]
MSAPKVAAILLGYKEPGWTKRTFDCALQAEFGPIFTIAREDGVGPMSSVFNAGMELMIEFGAEWVWHLTNVAFPPEMIGALLEHGGADVAAIHPVFDSDHRHLRAGKQKEDGACVPFVEWTAPLVSVQAWQEVGPLDEEMGYWGFDLDWSHRARVRGFQPKVCTTYKLDHTYLRVEDSAEHTITKMRRSERARHDVATEARLKAKWGEDWLAKLWPTHPHVAKGRKYLYKENK